MCFVGFKHQIQLQVTKSAEFLFIKTTAISVLQVKNDKHKVAYPTIGFSKEEK